MTTRVAKLLRLDGFNRAKHINLKNTDECYYWREYTTGNNYTYGETNQIIHNFKISVLERHRQHHKIRAIEQLAQEFIQAITKESFYQNYTFVPVPSSKLRNDPEHDNRLIKLLNEVSRLKNTQLDIRDMIIQYQNVPSAHTLPANDRISETELYKLYKLDQYLLNPQPKALIIFDDILTKGAHFKAVQRRLHEQYPKIKIIGLFVARAINTEYRV